METCSWCTDEVPVDELKALVGGDGALICSTCQTEVTERANGAEVTFR